MSGRPTWNLLLNELTDEVVCVEFDGLDSHLLVIEPEIWPDGIDYLKRGYPEHAEWLDNARAEIERKAPELTVTRR